LFSYAKLTGSPEIDDAEHRTTIYKDRAAGRHRSSKLSFHLSLRHFFDVPECVTLLPAGHKELLYEGKATR
jgi:hypothetical protein